MESDVIELVRHWIVFLCRQAIISLGPWGFHFVESKSVILFCESSNTKDCTILVDQLDSDKNEHQNEAVSNHVKLMRVINSVKQGFLQWHCTVWWILASGAVPGKAGKAGALPRI